MDIVYCDNHLLVVQKPVGTPSQADESGDLDLLSQAKAYLKQRFNKPGEVFLGLVHRLDRPASGLMVFARTSKSAARLVEQFKQHTVQKHYLAQVHGHPPLHASWQDFLCKKDRIVRVVSEAEGGQLAKLHFRVISLNAQTALVHVQLLTGRPHQIRVQFSSRGFALVGDVRYGSPVKMGQGLCLHAMALELKHPTQPQNMLFVAPNPPDWLENEPVLQSWLSQLTTAFKGRPWEQDPHVWIRQN